MDIVFAAGGTGGHIFPALAVANRLTKEKPGIKLIFAGRAGSMEEKLVKDNGYDMKPISAVRMNRSLIGLLKFAIAYPLAVIKTSFLLGEVNPKFVFATGGYVAGTVGMAAYLRGIPLILQEQNSIPGLSSKLLNLFSKITFTGYPDAGSYLKRKSAVEFTGNPVRETIGRLSRSEGCSLLGCDENAVHLLIIGGSQGAQSINRAVSNLAGGYLSGKRGLNLIWQCGRHEEESISRICFTAGIKSVVRPFFDRMDAVYAVSDIAICRGGAITLAELARAGIPMIIVPYPYAAADHQTANALYYQKVGAGIVVKDDGDIEQNLRNSIESFISSSELKEKVARAAKRIGEADAAGLIANRMLELLSRVENGS